MGRVVVSARIENLYELLNAEKGLVTPDQVHTIDVSEALVDTGATLLSMPKSLVGQLGFDKPFSTRRSRTTGGERATNVYGPVRLTVQGRFCHVDVAEIAEGCPVLIGQIPLELLDFVADPSGQYLIGNPRHNGEQMIELYFQG